METEWEEMKRWPTKPLGEFAEVIRGVSFDKSQVFGAPGQKLVPILRAGNIQDSLLTDSDLVFVPAHLVSPEQRMRQGDLAVCMSSGSPAIVGKSAHLESDWDGSVGAFCAIVRFNEKLHHRFGSYWFRSPAFTQWRDNNAKGANIQNLRRTELESLSVPIPPLPEQERIVKLLDEADELRKLRAQANRRTAALIPSLFYEMFGQADFVEKTIGQFLEQGWLLLHKDGNHGSLYPRSSDFGIEGIPFLSATCVNDEGTIDHLKVKRLVEAKAKLLRHGWIEPGDVLLAHNASVGAVGFYDGDYDRAIIGTSLTVFRANPDRIEPRFLWASLRDLFFQDQLERIMKQALRNQVPITAQRELFLRIPALALQKEFAARVSDIRAVQAEQAASRRRLDDLFQSMLHRAFQGDL